jgi:diaminohydroxyphosphoribosylaminopyrimidine deaminase/5-amino-6-(5-phosphoribosylamino)uracil reductase
MSTDEHYMARAIQLARMGEGSVAPNPMVGAVIVHNDIIIGEGYHESFGEAHAEVNAINAVRNPKLLPESTIYVSLEPCAHYGKTPPCADLIVSKKLKRVVIGCTDPFSKVDGKGIERLRQAGIEVGPFVLEKEAQELNERFFTFHNKKRPFVVLKWAESPDGFLDRTAELNDTITWISRPEVQPIVHRLRAIHPAILVGKNTILNDNPSLTVRAVTGSDPIRVVLDSHCELPQSKKIFQDGNQTWILNVKENSETTPVRLIKVKEMSPKAILDALYEEDIQSILIEGGAATLQSFIDAELWDYAIQIKGQSLLKAGTKAPKLFGTLTQRDVIFGDCINYYRP